jgi:hypothetical protein
MEDTNDFLDDAHSEQHLLRPGKQFIKLEYVQTILNIDQI